MIKLERCPGARTIPELISEVQHLVHDAFYDGGEADLLEEEDDEDDVHDVDLDQHIRALILDTLEGHGVDVTEWRHA